MIGGGEKSKWNEDQGWYFHLKKLDKEKIRGKASKSNILDAQLLSYLHKPVCVVHNCLKHTR